MRALTVCQPYAHLIASGEKPIENRTWATSYRGPLAIHAGKSRSWLDDGDLERYPDMVFGAIVAIVDLVDCRRIEHLDEPLRSHEHANGPYCFVLANVRRLDAPVKCLGTQGFWNWYRTENEVRA